MQLNPLAVQKAHQLIDHGLFRISTPWQRIQPTPNAAQKYLTANGTEAYSAWFLAVDPSLPEDDPARYQWPIGDFNALHRSGLIAARDLAHKHQLAEIAGAVEDILFLFDRLTAC